MEGSLPNVLTLGNKQWELWLSKFPCKLKLPVAVCFDSKSRAAQL